MFSFDFLVLENLDVRC